MKPRTGHCLRAALLLGVLCVLPAVGRANFFYAKFAGLVGDVTLADPKLTSGEQAGWIQIDEAGDGFSAAFALNGTSKPYMQDVMLRRPAGILSPELFQGLGKGTRYSKVDVREYTSLSPINCIRLLKLEDVSVSSYQCTQSGDATTTELLGLFFRKVTVGDLRYASSSYDVATAMPGGISYYNSPPTLAVIADQTTSEDTPVAVSLTVGDPNGLATVTQDATSNNPSLLPAGAFTFSGTGATRTITLTPAPNQNGTAVVSVIATDGLLQVARSFTLTVTPVNDPPTVAAITTQTMAADTSLDVAFSVSDPDTTAANITVTGSSGAAALLPNSGIVCTGTGTTRSVKLTPAAGAYGSVLVTLVANDGALTSAPQSFQLNVTPPPTAPTDVLLSANTVPENSAAGTVIGTLSAADLNGGPHTFELLSPVGGPFAINGTQLVVAPGAALDFETTTAYVLSVRATDATALTFTGPLTINVTAVNEAPTLAGLSVTPQAVLRGQTATVPAFTVSDPDATSLSVTLSATQGTLAVTGADPALTIGGNGTNALTLSGPIAALNLTLDGTHVAWTAPADFPAATPQNVLLAVDVSDNGQSGAGGVQTAGGTIPFRGYRHRIEQWREEHFTAPELANPALEGTLWGNSADPDGDGLNNVGEYAFHRDPRLADSELAPQPVLAVAPDTKPHLHLVLPVRDDDPELAVWFESGDAPADLSIATVETVTTQPYAPGYSLRTLRDAVAVPNSARRFIRAGANLQYQP